jgi:hypothetical protein
MEVIIKYLGVSPLRGFSILGTLNLTRNGGIPVVILDSSIFLKRCTVEFLCLLEKEMIFVYLKGRIILLCLQK